LRGRIKNEERREKLVSRLCLKERPIRKERKNKESLDVNEGSI
jgi:hypothetical protein